MALRFRRLFLCMFRRRRIEDREDLIPEARRASLPKEKTTIVVSRASDTSCEKAFVRIDCCVAPSKAKKAKSRLRRPSTKTKSRKRETLATVTEEEEEAFSRQLALLDEDPSEWDPNAGIGSDDYETGAITPPAVITTARASSPSSSEKVAETSKRNLQKLVAKVHIFMDKDFQQTPPISPNPIPPLIQKSKSAPNLSTLGGKGLAGAMSSSDHNLHINKNPSNVHTPHIPHSWRVPSRSIVQMPHIREPVIPTDMQTSYFEPKHHEHSVMARTMWKNGEIRFEDQWGRRLVPVGRQDSFAFELWPVPEGAEDGDDKKSQSSDEPEDLVEEDRIRWRARKASKGKQV